MSRGFRIVVAVVVLVGMIAMPPLVPAWTTKATLAVAWVELLCAVVLGAVIAPARISVGLWRVLAGLIFVTFVGYLVLELVASGGRITVSKRSQHSVLSALAGLIIVGWPCLKFALRGPAQEEAIEGDADAEEAAPD